jgi:threonine dehydrogenase-like Zn-dependent dehydrogenase
LLRKLLTLLGSLTLLSVIQAECARFVADRYVDVDRLFTQTFCLDEADAAYKLFDTQTTGKGVILM